MSLLRIRNANLQDIKNGIQYLLSQSSASSEVRELSLSIVQNKADRIAAIYDWIKANVPYVPDPLNKELFTSPVKIARDYKAGLPIGEDCDGMAILATALYRSIGIEAKVVLIDQAGDGLDHAYCQAMSDKLGWVNVDPSSPDIPLGWTVPFINRKIVV